MRYTLSVGLPSSSVVTFDCTSSERESLYLWFAQIPLCSVMIEPTSFEDDWRSRLQPPCCLVTFYPDWQLAIAHLVASIFQSKIPFDSTQVEGSVSRRGEQNLKLVAFTSNAESATPSSAVTQSPFNRQQHLSLWSKSQIDGIRITDFSWELRETEFTEVSFDTESCIAIKRMDYRVPAMGPISKDDSYTPNHFVNCFTKDLKNLC